MPLKFSPKLYSALAIAVAALIYGAWIEPMASASEDEAVVGDNTSSPIESSATEHPTDVTKAMKEKTDDLEVIDLNEPLDDQAEKWDSAKTRYQSQATPVTIENIVEPSSEYRYASFGKQNPFLPPLKSADDVGGLGGDMSPASDLAMASISSGVNTAATTTADNGAISSGKTHEIPVVSTLQKFPLSNLMLKGVWQLDTGEKRAIVMTPQAEGVIVKVSDPISAGKVLEINRDHLVVRQYRLREDGVREFADENLYLGDAVRKEKTFVRLLPGQAPEFEPKGEAAATGTVQEKVSGAPEDKASSATAPSSALPPPAPTATKPESVRAPAGSVTPATVTPAAVAPATFEGPLGNSVPPPFGAPAPTTPASTTGSSQP